MHDSDLIGYFAVATPNMITMGKSNHFIGQPLYSQALKLLDKQKILQIGREKNGERYVKRFNTWPHLVVMLYAVFMRFDSLREITASLLAEARLPMPTSVGRRQSLRAYTGICTAPTGKFFPRTAAPAGHQNG